MRLCGHDWGDCAAEILPWAHRCFEVEGHRGGHNCKCGKLDPNSETQGLGMAEVCAVCGVSGYWVAWSTIHHEYRCVNDLTPPRKGSE